METKKEKSTRKYGGVGAGQRTENRRAAFIEAGLEAFGTTGYAKSSIKSICDLAGLTQRYFYESFENKEDLFSAVYAHVVGRVLGTAWAGFEQAFHTPDELVIRILRTYYQSLYQDRRTARILYFEILGISDRIDHEYQDGTRRLIDLCCHVLCRAFPVTTPEELSKTIVPTGLAGAVNLIAANWSLDDYSTPLEEILIQVQALAQAFEGYLRGAPEAVERKKSK